MRIITSILQRTPPPPPPPKSSLTCYSFTNCTFAMTSLQNSRAGYLMNFKIVLLMVLVHSLRLFMSYVNQLFNVNYWKYEIIRKKETKLICYTERGYCISHTHTYMQKGNKNHNLVWVNSKGKANPNIIINVTWLKRSYSVWEVYKFILDWKTSSESFNMISMVVEDFNIFF